MPNEDPAPCFIVIGIVIIVFDLIIIESSYLIYFGGFFIFLGIIAGVTSAKKTQKTITNNTVHSHIEQQTVQFVPQNIEIIEETHLSHKFCPYCGSNTTSETCSACGQKID